MFYKEDIVIEGCVTEKLYRNIMTYVQALLKDFSPILRLTAAGEDLTLFVDADDAVLQTLQ